MTLVTESKTEDADIQAAMELWKKTCYNSREPFSRRRLALKFSRNVRVNSAVTANSARTSGGSAPTLAATANSARTSARSLSEIGKLRRKELTHFMRLSSSAVVSKRKLKDITLHGWTPSMQREETLMKARRAACILETTAAGINVPDHLLVGFSRTELCTLYEADQERLRTNRNAKYARKQLAFSPRAEQNLRGKSVMFSSANVARFCTDAVSLLGLEVVTDAKKATLFCTDLAGMTLSTKMHVFLHGGFIVQPEFLTSQGQEGSFLHVRPALHVQQRQLWMSGPAAETDPHAYLILADALASRGSKWTWFVGSNVEFLKKAVVTPRLIGIVTAKEYAAFPKGFVNVMTLRQFLAKIVVYNTTTTQV